MTKTRLEDIFAALDYCQSDGEWEDFEDWLLNDGSSFISIEDEKILQNGDKKFSQSVLERAAKNEECNHIWAVAQRARDYLNDM